MKAKKWAGILLVSLVLPAFYLGLHLHHRFLIGMNPFLGFMLALVVLILVAPPILFFSRKAKGFFRIPISLTPGQLFLIVAVELFAFDLLLLIYPHAAIILPSDFYLFYNVSGFYPFDFILGMTGLFTLSSASYYFFPRIFRRSLHPGLGYAHFCATLIGLGLACLVYWPLKYAGPLGMPRGYVYIDDGHVALAFASQITRYPCPFSWPCAILVFSQVLFVFNIIYSLFPRNRAEKST